MSHESMSDASELWGMTIPDQAEASSSSSSIASASTTTSGRNTSNGELKSSGINNSTSNNDNSNKNTVKASLHMSDDGDKGVTSNGIRKDNDSSSGHDKSSVIDDKRNMSSLDVSRQNPDASNGHHNNSNSQNNNKNSQVRNANQASNSRNNRSIETQNSNHIEERILADAARSPHGSMSSASSDHGDIDDVASVASSDDSKASSAGGASSKSSKRKRLRSRSFTPSFRGKINNRADIEQVFDAARVGRCQVTTERIDATDADLLGKGFVFRASADGGLQRWTEGRRWTRSRPNKHGFQLYSEAIDIEVQGKIKRVKKDNGLLKCTATDRKEGSTLHCVWYTQEKSNVPDSDLQRASGLGQKGKAGSTLAKKGGRSSGAAGMMASGGVMPGGMSMEGMGGLAGGPAAPMLQHMRHYQPLFQPTGAAGGAGGLGGGIPLSQQQAADQERTFAEFNKAASEAYKKYSERYRKYARNGPPNAAVGGVMGGSMYQHSQAMESTGRGGVYGHLHPGQVPHHSAASHIHGAPPSTIPGTASGNHMYYNSYGAHGSGGGMQVSHSSHHQSAVAAAAAHAQAQMDAGYDMGDDMGAAYLFDPRRIHDQPHNLNMSGSPPGQNSSGSPMRKKAASNNGTKYRVNDDGHNNMSGQPNMNGASGSGDDDAFGFGRGPHSGGSAHTEAPGGDDGYGRIKHEHQHDLRTGDASEHGMRNPYGELQNMMDEDSTAEMELKSQLQLVQTPLDDQPDTSSPSSLATKNFGLFP